MWCNINLMIITTVCVPLINSAAVIHYLEKAYACGEQLTLKCVITQVPCCSNGSRIWRKNNHRIMDNGEPIIITKYSETINDNEGYFTLNINSLQQEDFEQEYECSYSVYSAAIRLNKNYIHSYYSNTCDRCCKLPFFGQRNTFANADYYKFEGKDYPKRKVKIAFAVAIPLFVIIRWFEMVAIPSGLIGVSCSICYYNIQYVVAVFGLHMFTFISFYEITLKYINGDKATGTYCCELFINWFFFIPSLVISLAFFWVWSKKPSATPYEIHNMEEEDNAESQL